MSQEPQLKTRPDVPDASQKPARIGDRMMAALRYPGTRIGTKVLSALAYFDGSICSPGVDVVGDMTGLSRRSVFRGLKELEIVGVVTRLGTNNRRRSYGIDYAKIATAVVPTTGAFRDGIPWHSSKTTAGTTTVTTGGPPTVPRAGTNPPDPPIKDQPDLNRKGTGNAREASAEFISTLWTDLMGLYLGSGHSKKSLTLNPARRKLLRKSVTQLKPDDGTLHQGGENLVHLLAYWLYRQDPFWRHSRKGSQIIGTLLRHTEVSTRFLEAESWDWDGVIRKSPHELTMAEVLDQLAKGEYKNGNGYGDLQGFGDSGGPGTGEHAQDPANADVASELLPGFLSNDRSGA